jgi:DNA-binding transcriptional MerR regulator
MMFESYGDEPIYNVKAVVGQSGVSASTLRAWERRYGLPAPPRNTNGYRLYSARDIAIIRWLKAQVDTGLSISQAVNLLHLNNRNAPPATPVSSVTPVLPIEAEHAHTSMASRNPATSHQHLQDELLRHALNYDEMHMESTLSLAFSLYSVEDVCLKLLQPLLVTIGEGWHRGEITISAEHFASNFVQRKLQALIAACPPPTRPQKIVVGCAPEEFHEIGILFLALFLRRRGVDVVYLGQNVATARLDEMVRQVQPAILVLAATTLPAAMRFLDALDELQTAHSLTVAYGGHIFQRLPLLRDALRLHAVYLGDDLPTGVERIVSMLVNPDLGHITAPTREQGAEIGHVALAREYQARQAEITLRVTQNMLMEGIASPPHAEAELPEHLLQSNRHFAHALGAALRLDEPVLLRQMIDLDASSEAGSELFDRHIQTVVAHFRLVINALWSAEQSQHINQFLITLDDAR